MKQDIYDFIAIGLGPFNLSLACLTDPISELNGLFLERNAEFSWHPGMLIENTTLQNSFLADLVSLADPKSRFSYLNYCKEEGKIYSYYFREDFYLTRSEYNAYCRWAASQLSNVRFGYDVQEVNYDRKNRCYTVSGICKTTHERFFKYCRKLVLGVGSKPAYPNCCKQMEQDCFHTENYIDNKKDLQKKRSITVIGSGQSAAEVYYDLLREIDQYDYSLVWITRSQRFFQMETTKLTLEMFSPDYIDYFFHLSDEKKDKIVCSHDCLYKGVNAKLINQIYDLLDDLRRRGKMRTHLITNCELQRCHKDVENGSYELEFCQRDFCTSYIHRSEGVVFATGYREDIPFFINNIRHRIRWDDKGRYQLTRNYAADIYGNEIYVQNPGQHTHGMTNQDLGMCCYRNSYILRELTGVEYYKIETRIALQDFSIPETSDFVKIE